MNDVYIVIIWKVANVAVIWGFDLPAGPSAVLTNIYSMLGTFCTDQSRVKVCRCKEML